MSASILLHMVKKESLHKELSENKDQVLQVKIEMGQASEKLYAVEEKYKGIGNGINSNIDLHRKKREFWFGSIKQSFLKA